MAKNIYTVQEQDRAFEQGVELLFKILKDSPIAADIKSVHTKIGKDPILQALREVHDTILCNLTGVKYPLSLQKDDKLNMNSMAEF